MKYSNTKKTNSTLNKIKEFKYLDILKSKNITPFFELHSSPNHRERIFTPTISLSLFLKQALSLDRSCSNAVNNFIIDNIKSIPKNISNSTGSFCRSRNKIPLDLIKQLTQFTSQEVKNNLVKDFDIQGNIYLIDGTTFSMPDTEANQKEYPQQKTQGEGLGFPICRAVGVFCLESGVAINAELAPYKGKEASEHHILRKLLGTFDKGDLIVGDALYSSFWLIEHFQRNGIDFVFQQNGARSKKTDFRLGEKLARHDHIVEYKKPEKPHWMLEEDYVAIPKKISVRELKVNHKILVTSLDDHVKFPALTVNDIYKSRWNIELDFRNLKTTMSLSKLSCKSPKMCEKEIWIYLLANNLIRILMMQASINFKIKPRSISFKCTLQIWNKVLESFKNPLEAIEDFLFLMTGVLVGNRPGRVEPRARKRRASAYSLLMVPRHMAQANIRKNGHPKKTK